MLVLHGTGDEETGWEVNRRTLIVKQRRRRKTSPPIPRKIHVGLARGEQDLIVKIVVVVHVYVCTCVVSESTTLCSCGKLPVERTRVSYTPVISHIVVEQLDLAVNKTFQERRPSPRGCDKRARNIVAELHVSLFRDFSRRFNLAAVASVPRMELAESVLWSNGYVRRNRC